MKLTRQQALRGMERWMLMQDLTVLRKERDALRATVDAARNLVDAMETCHVCKGQLLVDESPSHCEDCSPDCDDHEGDECPSIFEMHLSLKRFLAALPTEAGKAGSNAPVLDDDGEVIDMDYSREDAILRDEEDAEAEHAANEVAE